MPEMSKNTKIFSDLLGNVASWCESQQVDGKPIDENTPFELIKREWKNRFQLWEEITPFVSKTLGITGFYPDEIAINETVGGLCCKLAEKIHQSEYAENRTRSGKRELSLNSPEKQIDQPTVFILSSPRSGSTLFRTMLAGHPELNAPPELHLLGHNSLKSRERFFVDTNSTWRVYGLVQTLASQMRMTEDQAFALLSKLTDKDLPVCRVYELIHSSSSKPVLVDKTPFIIRSKATLDQAEQMFNEPKYIHLVRHPGAVIESLERMRNVINLNQGEDGKDRLSRLKNSEDNWRAQNRNVQEFLSGLSGERRTKVLYEDLVSDPPSVMLEVAKFIGVDYDDSMLDPYAGDRLITGIGDPNITSRDKVDPLLAGSWKTRLKDYHFDAETLELAEELGVVI